MFVLFALKVSPSSGKQAFALDKSGVLKCYLKSVPENGQANLELIKFLAKTLRLPQNKIEIIAGATGRHKKIKIYTDLSYDQILQIVGLADLAGQKTMF